MPPLRRYLRITKYLVLECRIYLNNPSLAQPWLLNPHDNVLQRVIESIRPLVLPKLREKSQRDRKKGPKKREIKDVFTQEDFEVSIFLTETSTCHSLLAKHKRFREEAPRIHSNSTRLLGETQQDTIELDAPQFREEEGGEEAVCLADVPFSEPHRRPKRGRKRAADDAGEEAAGKDGAASAIDISSDEDGLAAKRPRAGLGPDGEDSDDDKKKMTMDVSYEGFAIYGRVLCLFVTRRDPQTQDAKGGAKSTGSSGQGQAKMTNWISSTQAPVGEEETA